MNILYNALIPLISAFVGGYISIWVFNKGYKKEQLEERKKRIQNNYETEEYFKLNLKSLLLFIDYQIDEISKTSKKSKDWKAKNLKLPIMSELRTNDLRELDFKTLFQIFVIDREGEVKKKSSDFINVKNCLNNIEDFIIKHQNEYEKIHKQLDRNVELWNLSLKNLQQTYNQFATEAKKDDDELMPLLQSYIITKQRELIIKGFSNDMDKMYNEMLFPLTQKIAKIERKNDIRIPLIIEHLILCRKSYESIKYIRYERRKGILLSGRRLLEIKRLLKTSLTSMEKRKKRIE